MANFPTHIAVGTVVSGALATVTVAADMVAPENIVAVTLAGVLGSVLPDIDLKDSRPGRAMFAGLAVFFSFAVLFSLERQYSIAEMLILWMGTLVAVRYVAKEIFFRFSYHRGIWHSLLATVFCAFLTAWIYSTLLGRNEGVAWLAAGFMAIGYLTHLILDEIYSVDVMDTRIKASFGTALKPVDFKHPGHSTAMARRHRAGVPADAAHQHVPREHHLARRCGAACSTACCRTTSGSASTGAARPGCPTCRSAPRPRPKPCRPPRARSPPARSRRRLPGLRRRRSGASDSDQRPAGLQNLQLLGRIGFGKVMSTISKPTASPRSTP